MYERSLATEVLDGRQKDDEVRINVFMISDVEGYGTTQPIRYSYYLVWKRLKDGMCVAQCMLTAAPELDWNSECRLTYIRR